MALNTKNKKTIQIERTPMNPEPNATLPLRLAGMAIPLVDVIIPSMEELHQAEQFVGKRDWNFSRVQKPENRQLLEQTRDAWPTHIMEAKQALKELRQFAYTQEPANPNAPTPQADTPLQRKFKAGTKPTLSVEDARKVAGWAEKMLIAARDVNRLAAFLDQPEQLKLRFMGGSLPNKFHAIQAGMGEAVQTHLLGAMGDEDKSGNKARAEKELTASHLNFQSFEDVSLGNMPISYIFPVSGDRIALKAPLANLPEKIASHLGEISTFLQRPSPDYYFIEGSDLSEKKFGKDAFTAFANQAMDSGKPIIFGTPTDEKLITGNSQDAKENRSQLLEIVRHPSTRFISCNDEELVTLFKGEVFNDSDKPQNPANHSQVRDALDLLQPQLRTKKDALSKGDIEPVAFVSLGSYGAMAVTASQRVLVPCEATSRFVNNIGAGDNFTAGCFMEYEKITRKKSSLPGNEVQTFTEEELQSMLRMGQALGKAAVEQKGAQLPPATIAEIVHGAPPLQGKLAAAITAPEQTRGIA